MLHAPPLIGHTILPRLADHPTWALFANITTILVFLYNQPKHKLAIHYNATYGKLTILNGHCQITIPSQTCN